MRSGKQREAIPFFERAVELDPQFCSAYAVLGTAYLSVGNDEAVQKNFAKAFELKDGRLTQEENFQTTALYYSYITGQPGEGNYRSFFCTSKSIHAALLPPTYWGSLMRSLGRTEEALQAVLSRASNFLRCPPLSTTPMPARRS